MSKAPPPEAAPRKDGLASLIRAGASLDPLEARLAMQRIRSQLQAHVSTEPITIGRHHVIGRIGEGGFGAVYEAFDPQLERKLAVKVLRVGLDDEDATKRALREAKLAAKVSHPNVVAVFDVGLLDQVEELGAGVYMAMEHVEGDTLASWMLAHRHAEWREVVGIFVQAGRGLAAAHAAGVVHRDFKPGNVLLGPDDRVRVADFGLASSATPGPGRGEGPSGTPAYMAPEQHRGDTGDARSDIYSFCVALYEALVGDLPFPSGDVERLVDAKLDPSLRWPSRVPPHLRAVAERGLASDPAARFESMDALLAELARDPQARRRRLLGGGVVVIGAIGLGYLMAGQPTEDERAAACASERASELSYDADEVAAAFESTGVPFAAKAWNKAQPAVDAQASAVVSAQQRLCADRDVLARSAPELLERRERCLDRRAAELQSLVALLAQPDAQTVTRAVGAAYELEDPALCNSSLAGLPSAAPTDESAIEQFARVEDLIARIRAEDLLGRYAQADPLADELVANAESLPESSLRAEAYLVAARSKQHAGDPQEAERLGLQAALEAEASGDDHLTATTKIVLAYLVGYELSRAEEGLVWARNAGAALRRIDSDAKLEAMHHGVLGALYQREGRFGRAREHFEQALDLELERHEPDHPSVAKARMNVAFVARAVGDFDSAQSGYREALRIQTEAFGPEHPRVAEVLMHVGQLALAQGDVQHAGSRFERALTIRRASMPAEHPAIGRTLQWLGDAHAQTGQSERAVEEYLQSIEILRAAYPAGHPDIAYGLGALGTECVNQGDFENAERRFRESLAVWTEVAGEHGAEVAIPLNALGELLRSRGRAAEARAMHERALSIATETFGPKHPRVASSLAGLGQDLLALGEHATACDLLRRALTVSEELELDPALIDERRVALERCSPTPGAASAK